MSATLTPALPAWATTLKEKYLGGEAIVFVLHGNVFDRHMHGTGFAAFSDVLADAVLGATKKCILELSLAQGLRALKWEAAGEAVPTPEQSDLGSAFQALSSRLHSAQSHAVIIPYAETLFPAAETQMLSFDERAALTTLHRWSLDDDLGRRDHIIMLVTESLAALAPALLNNPRVALIEVDLPDAATRTLAVHQFAPDIAPEQATRIAEHTAGLRIVQIASILGNVGSKGLDEAQRCAFIIGLLGSTPDAVARARQFAAVTAGMSTEAIRNLIAPAHPLPQNDVTEQVLHIVRRRKREIIEKECTGLIEFIEPRHGLDAVGGNEDIKRELMQVAQTLREQDRRRAPMGLLAVGPMGAGKTFVIKAFLKEAGLNAIALKNFRSRWVGATESNLERVLATVKAMGPIALIIDEGDRSFGSRSEDSDGGTSSRVIARLKEFMSDTENRGQVLFILMTNRPDKLDTDIKRPGRLDRKIPFFYAETGSERWQVMAAVLARNGYTAELNADAAIALCEPLAGYSNADLEALALLAADLAGNAVSSDALKAAIDDFIPPREQHMIRYMELLAVAECSRRSLLPPRLRALTPAALQEEMALLRQIIPT